ncbi:hypothetical protein DL93DRAFT_938551 [Clavulina sp. PMI_390]|nr:hypothetical protein DL93DRAFT_938551 [Clavulina sp. PMI_390]
MLLASLSIVHPSILVATLLNPSVQSCHQFPMPPPPPAGLTSEDARTHCEELSAKSSDTSVPSPPNLYSPHPTTPSHLGWLGFHRRPLISPSRSPIVCFPSVAFHPSLSAFPSTLLPFAPPFHSSFALARIKSSQNPLPPRLAATDPHPP